MKKTKYNNPTVEVLMINSDDIIITSDPSNINIIEMPEDEVMETE